MSLKVEKKILLSFFGVVIILILGFLGYQKFGTKQSDLVVETRKKEIAQGVQAIFKPCTDISTFDLRRECFKDKLVEMKKKNPIVQTDYTLELKGKAEGVVSEDLGDLLKITIPENLGFVRCISNTFFFDRQGNAVFISMENPLASVLCNTASGDEILISPKKIETAQKAAVKQMFKSPIN